MSPAQAASKRAWAKVMTPFLTGLSADLGAQKTIYMWWGQRSPNRQFIKNQRENPAAEIGLDDQENQVAATSDCQDPFEYRQCSQYHPLLDRTQKIPSAIGTNNPQTLPLL